MKKINLFLVFALAMMIAPAVSFAEKAEGNKPETTTAVVKGNEDKGMNKGGVSENQEMSESGDMVVATTSTTTEESEEVDEVGQRSEARRSSVANAVQEMVKAADRVGGLGEQVRVIAQEQNRIQEEAETAVQEAAKRGGFLKFIIGPNYKKLKEVEDKVAEYTQKLEEVKTAKAQITATDVVTAIDAQIAVLEQAKTDLQTEIDTQKGGFSLFGWLNKILAK